MTDDELDRLEGLAENCPSSNGELVGPARAPDYFAYIAVANPHAVLALIRELRQARRDVRALESLRPVWAQGWTPDGVAAQASAGALSQLWGLLGAEHQTAAVQKLRSLIALEKAMEMNDGDH